MNRREFVKALAGIPLLGLLVKVPEAKEAATWMMVGPSSGPIEVDEGSLSITSAPLINDHWINVGDAEPFLPCYWDGKEWADIMTRWSNDIANAAAQRLEDEIMKA